MDEGFSHVDVHRGDGKRFIVRADEKLTAFPELEDRCAESAMSKAIIEIRPPIAAKFIGAADAAGRWKSAGLSSRAPRRSTERRPTEP